MDLNETVSEKLHWPEQELSRKTVLSPEELILKNEESIQCLSQSGILKDTFTTGTSSYNVLLQSKEEKKHLLQKHPSTFQKKQRKPTKASNASRSNERRKSKALGNGWCCLSRQQSLYRQPSLFITSPGSNSIKLTHSISVAGNSIGLLPPPKAKAKRYSCSSLTKPKQLQLSKSYLKEAGDATGRKLCILTAIRPSNVEKEKVKFFKSDFTYNPQFEYASPALSNVLAKHSQASSTFLKQAVKIMELTLQKYGSYEHFEQATGGSLLPRSRIWSHVRKYMVKEGCLGEIVVHLSEDLLSRASMTVVNGRPTLTINISTAREHWLEGMLRHEIGTHYLRGINNNSQPWNNWNGRRKHGLRPINPTEEGLASIHSVLLRKDPFLWRAALLYYTVYQASRMSFSQLFQDIGKFVKDPNTRWDYCVRAKRGWTDTSEPGCFSKDQVYLDGILRILRYRESIDFYLLTALGKVGKPVSYEDVDRLKDLAVTENMRVPHFLQDYTRYMEHLEKIMQVNELSDRELQALVP
ncbi:putative tyrosine carboxypeptidase MATCAP2 isoform X1 [Hemicordylus capensis]|uniref:putative tyrosine carboxypeptidase MATCAP2 isoform X1 n=1 Tax=Hemicordylus capensis TaxID=884348 RepID=UPI0023020A8E|nr:putative tyrosine carboxypeptidase MATCAP2 isoform X1 [Hemicordylus capensis]